MLITLATPRQDWTGSNPSRREGGGCGFTLSRSHSCCAVRLVYTQIRPGHIWTTLYIKSILWRVVKCLSYIEEARCLKVKALCTQQFSEMKLTKFKTDFPELAATDVSNRCLSYVPTMVGYIVMNLNSEEQHEKHSVVTGIFEPISAFAWMQTHRQTENRPAEVAGRRQFYLLPSP